MACSSCATIVRVVKGRLHSLLAQMMPAGVIFAIEVARPSKGKEDLQYRHLSVRRVQSLKRMESGIWLSSGEISVVWLLDEEEAMLYFRVSRPRHSARWTASVPGMGAQRRSIGGKICL